MSYQGKTKNPPGRRRVSRRSFRGKLLHYLAGLQATGADFNPLRPAVDSGIDSLQVYVETALADIVCVADRVSEARFFLVQIYFLQQEFVSEAEALLEYL